MISGLAAAVFHLKKLYNSHSGSNLQLPYIKITYAVQSFKQKFHYYSIFRNSSLLFTAWGRS